MPAVSKNQQVAMNLANAIQKGAVAPKPGTPSAQIASSMKPSDLGDFAGPVNPKLPKRVAPPPVEAPMGAPVQVAKKPMRVKNVGKPVKKMRF